MQKHLLYFIFLFLFSGGWAQEDCSNGVDDDADGLIDLNDTTDCYCNGFVNYNVDNLISNPSFEEHSACPTGPNQVSNADHWHATASADYYNYCGWADNDPHAAIPDSFPDGNGAIGFWNTLLSGGNTLKEYVSSCLNTKLSAGNTYIFSFYIHGVHTTSLGAPSQTNISLYGTSNCSYVPIPTSSINDCPEHLDPGHWFEIASQYTSESLEGWVKYTYEFSPTQDVYGISIGPDCTTPSTQNSGYYFIDQLSLIEKTFYNGVALSDTGNYCEANKVISSSVDSVNLSYQWYLNGIALSDQTLDSIIPPKEQTGIYQMRITSPNNDCGISDSIFYTKDSLKAFYSSDHVSCFNYADGKLQIDSLWGAPSFYYQLNGLSVNDSVFTGLDTGLYVLTVMDQCACTDTITVSINQPDSMQIAMSNIYCFDYNTDFELQGTVQGGTAPYQFWWDGQSSSSSTYTVNLPKDSSFTVHAQDTMGCITQIKQIHLLGKPDASFTLSDSVGCTEFCTEATFMPNSDFTHFYWMQGQNQYPDSLQTICISDTGSQYIDLIVQNNYCADTIQKAVSVFAIPKADFSVLSSDQSIGPESFYLQNQSMDYSHSSWIFEDSIFSNNEHTFIELDSFGVHSITLKVKSGIGCEDSITKNITITEPKNIFIPNSFTPNNDGINDAFMVTQNFEVLDYVEFQIQNRWGETVFKTNNIDAAWDGTTLAGKKAQKGMYIYLLTYRNARINEFVKHKGFVFLIE